MIILARSNFLKGEYDVTNPKFLKKNFILITQFFFFLKEEYDVTNLKELSEKGILYY